jgi:DNA-binding MarR family transcriptional regulator
MNGHPDGAANVLGALALFVAGEVRETVTAAAGAGGALGEALIAVKDQPGCTADWLAGVLHVTQPGTAHLVRRLRENGLLTRTTGTDGRSLGLHLTAEGEAAAARLLAARDEVLDRLVADLPDEDRAHLRRIGERLLRPPARDATALARLCRLCDRSRCPGCPVHAGYLDACPTP